MLLPEDIERRQFSVVRLREGYSQAEVDGFLDDIVVSYRQLWVERDTLRQAAERRPEIAETQDLSHVSKLLKVAETAAKEETDAAAVRAQEILQEARDQAKVITDGATREKHALMGEMEEMKSRLQTQVNELAHVQGEVTKRMQNALKALEGE